MGITRLLLFVLLVAVVPVQHIAATATHKARSSKDDDDFVRTTCTSTAYPHLCERCLASYSHNLRGSARRAAHTALSITLNYAKTTTVYVQQAASSRTKVSTLASFEAGIMDSCLTSIHDSVNRLRRSVNQMAQLGRPGTAGFSYHLNNVQSWASGALTDMSLCLEGFGPSDTTGGAGLSADARSKIERLQQLTSNALALVNSIASKV